ncbi:MAG: type II/IV secretion system protein [Clostridia bacterium]|nr:type II/IV secretion system protein [Clostridia bacterium]
MFESVKSKKNPIGFEFIKRGLLTETQVTRVLEYQKDHRELKFAEIVDILDMCPKNEILLVLSSKLNVEGIMLDTNLPVKPTDYLPRDVIINYRALPFKLEGNMLSVAFANIQDEDRVHEVELMLLDAGYTTKRYVTLYTSIMKQIGDVRTVENKFVDKDEKDTTRLIDNIIMTAITKRASDIHFEPMEDKVRIRYRIDGELISATEIAKDRQDIMVGRLKAISNMHQEISYDQDGSINTYDNYSIRVSSQRNVWGEKFVLRFLKKNSDMKSSEELGFPQDDGLVEKAFDKRNSLILVCAPTGEGKTTTLYSVLDYLNKPNINIVSIENPVEMRIPGINQIEIGPNITFASALRTVLRQDPDIILVGEIRDKETAFAAIEAGQTGHLVLSTVHTIDAVESITRLKKVGISPYDISSTLVTTLSQRLVRRLCTKCKKEHVLTEEERAYIDRASKVTGYQFDLEHAKLYEPVGCEHCNSTGYYERIGVFEVLNLDDDIKDMISEGVSTGAIRKYARQNTDYQPLVVDAIKKVLDGTTTIAELKRKITI